VLPCHPSTVSTKRALRQQAERGRTAPVSLDAALQDLVASATRVAAYWAIGNEPAVTVQPGWLLPVVTSDWDLDWAVYDGTLVRSRGLLEPAGPRLGVAAVASCDLVLVPALLVDRTGVRLGKGSGSYDRALTRATGLTVALVGDAELVDVLPTEDHDVRVAAVATPSSGVVRLPTKM
jgi:5-formyltetrahydrofolate cyclo-ligase